MESKIGFIGSGNMGNAIINGVLAKKILNSDQITVFDISKDKLAELVKSTGVHAANSECAVAHHADILFFAIKPNVAIDVLEKINDTLSKNTLIVSIVAGLTIDSIEKIIGSHHKIIRVMPNTPALVNEGMASITPNSYVNQADIDKILMLFTSLGRCEVVPEYLIHAVTGISGSAPAYVFIMIEAMADAAVLAGMPRDLAYKFAAQAVLGSAKMVLESGKHPGELKDMVCSPGGTTIEAVRALEEKGFRSAMIDAVVACINKSKSLSGVL